MKIRYLLACCCSCMGMHGEESLRVAVEGERTAPSIFWQTRTNCMYEVQRSADMERWTGVQTFLGSGGKQWVLLAAVGLVTFFRVEEYLNPLQDLPLYVDLESQAARLARSWESTRPAESLILQKIAREPQAKWLLGTSNDEAEAGDYARRAETSGKLPIFVLYNIPFRDCGSFSSGGAGDAVLYTNWLGRIISRIGERRVAVILEPDALAALDCLSLARQAERFALVSQAIGSLKAKTNILVYVDAGHARWKSVADMAVRLKKVDAGRADGFSLNVSNFIGDAETVRYGTLLSKSMGGMHFVIDTSRNGRGPTSDNAWCNPPGRALGDKPTIDTGNRVIDAFLWVKRPGESDGTCNGALLPEPFGRSMR